MPIPDPTPDEPEPIREPEPEILAPPLPPDVEFLIGIPEAPPPPPGPTGPLIAGTGDVTMPELIQETKVRPEYPGLARVARIEGNVILQAVIHADGTVGDLKVLRCTQTNWIRGDSRRGGAPVEVRPAISTAAPWTFSLRCSSISAALNKGGECKMMTQKTLLHPLTARDQIGQPRTPYTASEFLLDGRRLLARASTTSKDTPCFVECLDGQLISIETGLMLEAASERSKVLPVFCKTYGLEEGPRRACRFRAVLEFLEDHGDTIVLGGPGLRSTTDERIQGIR